MNVYLPGENLLICGDNFYKGFPNLYTIRGTPFRSLENWYKSLDLIREINPAFLIPSHGRPVEGREIIHKIITDYRDAIQFVHDQGIRGINSGMTPDELVSYIKLPEHLASSSYLTEYYGKVSWALRSLFSGNLGWFSGDAAELQPLSREEEARMILELSGGKKPFLEKIRGYRNAGKYQTVLQLTGHFLRLFRGHKEARAFKELLSRIRPPLKILGEFEYKKGNTLSFALFMNLFKPVDQKLAFQSYK